MFKPMLAATAPKDLSLLQYPLLGSYKLDGVRAVVRGGVVYSRSNKPIPNPHVQKLFRKCEYADGELIVGEPNAPDVFRKTTSGVMSHTGKPDVKFYVFDHVERPEFSFRKRRQILLNERLLVNECHRKPYFLVTQRVLLTVEELVQYEEYALSIGYEGIIVRSATAPYKFGRSTLKEGYLIKVKRWEDAEGVVVNFKERMHNANEAFTGELGQTKRSSHKENKVGRGDLGALILRLQDGSEVSVGSGFSDLQRKSIWANKRDYKGRLAKFKYFPIGVKDSPRQPIFLGFRDERDT